MFFFQHENEVSAAIFRGKWFLVENRWAKGKLRQRAGGCGAGGRGSHWVTWEENDQLEFPPLSAPSSPPKAAATQVKHVC